MKRKFRNIVRDLVVAFNPFFKKRKGSRVICFHDIQKKDLFRERMIWLKENFEIVSIDDIVNNRENTVAISFDDGYRSWITNVFPVIKELNIPACFFVNSGIVNLTEDHAKLFIKNKVRRQEEHLFGISKIQLVELSKSTLVTIGGHTMDHFDFSEEGNIEGILHQIRDDKSALEEIIGSKIDYFAYPFGQLSNAPLEVQDIVKSTGYKNGFTIIPGFRNRNPYLQNRDSLELWQSTRVWSRWLQGAYDSIVLRKLKLQGKGLS